jgi:hypothetical protein
MGVRAEGSDCHGIPVPLGRLRLRRSRLRSYRDRTPQHQRRPDEPESWYDYVLRGHASLTVWLAANPGANPVSRRVIGEMDDLRVARVETLPSVLAETLPNE